MMNKIIFFILICLEILLPASYLFAGDDVDRYINTMTLRQKIGQIIMIGIQERTLTKKDVSHLKKIRPGGIVFYARNFRDASDIPPLIAGIRDVIEDNGLTVFFAIDQEGGVVHRFEGGFYKPPSALTIGVTDSETLSRDVGLSVGNALKSLGININFAPVLDIPSNIMSSPMTMRCFGNSSRTVERLGVAYIQGLKESGILSTAKHFPGIGRSVEDSHRVMLHIKWRGSEEREADLMPFKGAIRAGVDFIMVGHTIAEPGDGKNPVSLSSHWMRKVLREEMGFNGLIIVDNIEMKPIKDMMSTQRAAVESFKAGADIIMVSHERENQEAVFQSLLQALKSGEISTKRLNESLRRILTAKRSIISCNKHEVPARNLSELTRVVAEQSVVGIKLKDAPDLTICKDSRILYAGSRLILFNAVKDIFRQADILNTSLENFNKIYPEISIEEFLRKFDALIIDTDYQNSAEIISLCKIFNIRYLALQSHLSDIKKIIERLKPKHMMIIFEVNKIHLETALDIISGIRETKGRLPFNLALPPGYVYIIKD